MATWQLQDAKAKFSELVDKAEKEGAQVITRRGLETVAVVPIEEWKRLSAVAKPSLKDVLLNPPTRHNIDKYLPRRGKAKLRPPIDFE